LCYFYFWALGNKIKTEKKGNTAGKRGQWTEVQKKAAIDNIRSKKMSVRPASEAYSVPKSSLHDRLMKLIKGKNVILASDIGTFRRTLSDEQEEELVAYSKDLDSRLMPLTKKEFGKLAFEFAKNLKFSHRFNQQIRTTGKDFYYDFMTRHPDLSLRCAEATIVQRAAGFNKLQVELFFDKLSELSSKQHFPPSRIFNADETGVTCVLQNVAKVLTVKGKRQVEKLTSGDRWRKVTLLFCTNAAGYPFIPPLFVFPRVRLDNEIKKDTPEGSLFDAQRNGWITSEGFLKWLKEELTLLQPIQCC
jgi:hypothetical protein